MRGEKNLLHSELEQRVEDFHHFFPTQQIKTMFIVLLTPIDVITVDGQIWSETGLMFL
jgi:hypothetical protein